MSFFPTRKSSGMVPEENSVTGNSPATWERRFFSQKLPGTRAMHFPARENSSGTVPERFPLTKYCPATAPDNFPGRFFMRQACRVNFPSRENDRAQCLPLFDWQEIHPAPLPESFSAAGKLRSTRSCPHPSRQNDSVRSVKIWRNCRDNSAEESRRRSCRPFPSVYRGGRRLESESGWPGPK